MVQYNAMQGLQAFGAGRQMGTEMRVGNALAEGNMQGAQQAAFRGGDNQLGMQLQQARQQASQQLRDRAAQASEQEAEQLAGVYQTAGQIANGLMTVPIEQRQQALMQIAPRLQQMGMPQEQLQQLAQALGDPNASDAVLQTYAALAVDADEIFKARAPVTLNQGDVRGGYQDGRFAQVGENVDEVGQANARTNARNADTSAMNARTSRMGETRQGEAMRRELAGESDQNRRAQALASRMVRNNLVLEDIDRAIDGSGNFGSTGFLGQIFSNVGGTGARDLEALIDTVRANIGFDELQRMRDMSPTGGALGQVTERELAQLQAVLGNLETSQSQAQLEQNLRRLQQVYSEAQNNIAEAYFQDFGEYPQGYRGGQGAPQRQPAQPGQSAPSGGGQRLRYNPQTGELE